MSNSTCSAQADGAFGPAIALPCRGGFDFTLLFEQSILTLLPASFFALVIPVRILYLFKKKAKTFSSIARHAKLAASVILALIQLSLIVLWARNNAARTVVSLPAAAVNLLVATLLVVLSKVEDERSVRPSSFALVYLLFTALFDMAQARSLWLHGDVTAISVVFSAGMGMKVLLLFLEAQQKKTRLQVKYQGLPPESLSGIISRSFLWWIIGLFRRGYRNLLPFDALYVLETELTSDYLGQKLQRAWDNRKRPERRFEYPLAVCRAFWWPLMEAAIPRFCLIGFMFAQPFLISRTLNLLSEDDGQMTVNIGYGLIGAAALIYLGIAISRLHYEYRFYRFLTMFRGASASLIYSRTLQLQDGLYDESAAVTLMGTDIDRIALSVTNLNECWARCIELAVGIYLLAQQLGWVCIMPIIIVLASSGASTIVSRQIGGRQKIWIDAVQKRISLTSSMLAEMRSVKMMGLSRLMTTSVQDQRVRETRLMGGYRWCIVWLNVIANTPEALVPAFTFAVYAIQATVRGSSSIGTSQAFTSLAIISLIINPAAVLLSAIPSTAASLGCFDRIQKFLVAPPRVDARRIQSSKLRLSSTTNSASSGTDNQEEIEMQPVALEQQTKRVDSTAIYMEEIDIRPAPETDILLKDIKFSIPSGTITMVVGSVGSGKTTLLRGVLGEVPLERGFVSVSSSRIAYCAQTPWLPNATIREVICGSQGNDQDFDEQWYSSTIHACALEHDLTLLPQGDQTEIGSGSTVLSGGQKHRVALARAVYARADIVVLDDVLSALDARTKKTVVDRLFGKAGLLKQLGSTVLLVTHDVAYLSFADKVLILSDGRIQHEGTNEQIMRQGLINALHLPTHDPHDEEEAQANSDTKTKSVKVLKDNEADDLTRATGDMAVYRYYFSHFGWWKGFLFFLGVVLNVFCTAFSQIWLKWWTDNGGGQIALYISIYFLLSVSHILGTFLYNWAICILIQVSTARKFHYILLKTVMRASQAFFSVTDSGSILNRFSQDMTLIEGQLPIGVLITVSNLFWSLAGAALIATGSTYMAATVPLLIVVIWVLQHVYLRTSRQLRLLDLEARSPLYSHFLETLSGLSTIRAFGWATESKEENKRLLDLSQRPYYLLYCVQRWLNLVLDLIVAGEAVVVVGLALGLRTSTTAGLLGVSLNNILSFNTSLASTVQGWTMMETSLGSIARLKDFEETVKPEDEEDKPEPPENWPEAGVIEFRGVTAAHNPSAVALRNISLTVKSGQKVGICGRTGSGKSSLVGTLLGLLDITGGTIIIDGVDVTTIRRDVVRERLVTLPQDPLILIGSVRVNADPAGTNNDNAIIKALTKVGLWGVLEERGGLDAEITASTLSKGQQQLLALARALLKKGKILLLDEPTSNVDAETDQIMQRILREEFADCTILTVAHRLNTIIDSDVVLVLDGGRLAEVGNPQELLKIDDSMFSKLARSSGTAREGARV